MCGLAQGSPAALGVKEKEESTMGNRIEIGDVVDVFFENVSPIFNAQVVDKPANVGDSWVLKDQSEGTIHHVCLFSKMTLLKKYQDPLS
jgi:hypothetical protein